MKDVKINSFSLSDKTVKRMFDLIDESKEKGIEIGFALCKESFKETLNDKDTCFGSRCTMAATKCDKSETKIGGFHTHPISDSSPSIGDVENAYLYGVECIGGTTDKKVKCLIRKSSYKTDTWTVIHKARDFENRVKKSYETRPSESRFVAYRNWVIEYSRLFYEWKELVNQLTNKYFKEVDL